MPHYHHLNEDFVENHVVLKERILGRLCCLSPFVSFVDRFIPSSPI